MGFLYFILFSGKRGFFFYIDTDLTFCICKSIVFFLRSQFTTDYDSYCELLDGTDIEMHALVQEMTMDQSLKMKEYPAVGEIFQDLFDVLR